MWQTILGAILGATLALAGTFISTRSQHRREERSLRRALAGELTAISDLIYQRDYLERLREHIEAIERTGLPLFANVQMSEAYNIIFTSNAHKIGLLTPFITKRLTIVYYRISAIKEDLQTLSDAAKKLPGSEWLHDVEMCRLYHKQLLELAESTFPLLRAAIKDLENRDHRGLPNPSRWDKFKDRLGFGPQI